MNSKGEIHPWALMGITMMVCITLISLVIIITTHQATASQANTVAASNNVPLAQAPVTGSALNDAPAGGGSCGSGGGCGCGGG